MAHSELFLTCRVHDYLCAIPAAHVVEVMRPSPIERLAAAPECVLGVSVVRGEGIPVVDAGLLTGHGPGTPARYVVLRVGERRVALAVDAVLTPMHLDSAALQGVPPLFEGRASETLQAIGTLDERLMVVLRTGRILSDVDPRPAQETESGP